MNWSLNRARLGAIMASLGFFCILMGNSLPSHSASAPESGMTSADPGKRFATVLRILGEVLASGGSSGKARQLREGDAVTSVDLGREELAQSTVAAMKGLKGYKQRRVSIEGRLADPVAGGACDRISLKSVVIEQGRQSGKPYRFESLEEYVLELRAGKWLAVKAETTQQ